MKKIFYLIAVLLLLILVSCSSNKNLAHATAMEDFFIIQKTLKEENTDWVILLPGTSGLTIFKDEQHYFKTAKALNEIGFSVMLIDYKRAYQASKRKVKETTGEKILWVLEEAIRWGRKHQIPSQSPLHVVGWSLAGEGLCLLANQEIKTKTLGISSIAMYYPSNQDKIEVKTTLPMLIQTGQLDQVTPHEEIKKYYGQNPKVQIIVYENAHHGYDVESLKEPKTIKFPPVFGKKYTFQFNEKATEESQLRLRKFLKP